METMAKSLSQSLSQDVGASQFAVTSATRLIIAVRFGCSGRIGKVKEGRHRVITDIQCLPWPRLHLLLPPLLFAASAFERAPEKNAGNNGLIILS